MRARLVILLALAGAAPLVDAALLAGAAWAEEVEEVEVAAVPAAAPAAPARGTLVGRLHPLLVHFPIAWLVLLLLVDGATWILRREHLAGPGLWLLGITAASFLVALGTGLLRADELEAGHREWSSVLAHRNWALAATTLCLLALGVRALRRNRLAGASRVLYLVLVVGAAGCVALAGHLGGRLVFGAGYLPF